MQENIKNDILTLHCPQNAIPLIFDSPHSGTLFPKDFNYDCDEKDLRKIEDTFVDDLFAAAPKHDATLLCANFPRSYLDINRAKDDIDPALINSAWPVQTHGAINPTSRSSAGIGLIPRLIKPGIPIYAKNKLTPSEIIKRIQDYYTPYHEALKAAIDAAHYNHGFSLHVNCHSMPYSSAFPKRAHTVPPLACDIVLGTRNGNSCSREITHLISTFWKKLGYDVSIDDPFKGVELVSAYAAPNQEKHSIQIEINRSLYMDEETREKTSGFKQLEKDCTAMIQHCADYISSRITPIAAD